MATLLKWGNKWRKHAFVNASAISCFDQNSCSTRAKRYFHRQRQNKIKLMENDVKTTSSSIVWYPANVINSPYTLGNGHICVVLNCKIKIPKNVAKEIWQKAHLRCLVDGGANRWRNFLETHCKNVRLKSPELLTGDFDSLTQETIAYFADEQTKQVCTPDQNATDFTKAIDVIQPSLKTAQLNDIIVFHDTSGRFDQIMANINTLFKVQNDKLNLYLLSGNSLTWLLRPGKHLIQIPQQLVEQQRWCALMPIGEPANNVSTTGLKWNLSNGSMQFGGLVSTSNTYAKNCVSIETETCLIWSMAVFSDDEKSP